MTKKPNPLTILGITKEILEEHNRFVIIDLVKSNFKTLSKHYHPDKVQSKFEKEELEDKLSLINEAYNSINPTKKLEGFNNAYEQYMKEINSSHTDEYIHPQTNDFEEELFKIKASFFDFFYNISNGSKKIKEQNLIHLLDNVTFSLAEVNLNQDIFENVYDVTIRDGVIYKKYSKLIDKFYKEKEKPEYETIEVKCENKSFFCCIPDSVVKKEYEHIRELIREIQEDTYSDSNLDLLKYNKDLYIDRDHAVLYSKVIAPFAFIHKMDLIRPKLSQSAYLFAINKTGNSMYISLEGEYLTKSEAIIRRKDKKISKKAHSLKNETTREINRIKSEELKKKNKTQ